MDKENRLTRIDLLVGIGVALLLLQVALPAVQSSREKARKAACRNNLRHIGLGCAAHIQQTGRFPTGGWGFLWAGDPDRGNDERQPGGWIYNLLPYLDENALHQVGAGQIHDKKLVSARQICQTPLMSFMCPSRRSVRTYPCETSPPMINLDFHTVSAKCDYSANSGDVFLRSLPGPSSLTEGDLSSYSWQDTSALTGVVYLRSKIEIQDVVDGLSKTLLVGEKYLAPEYYDYPDGDADGDDRPMYVGFDETSLRWTTSLEGIPRPPRQDEQNRPSPHQFGSSHTVACHFLFCDGSVRVVSYEIDGKVFEQMGNRKDSGKDYSEGP